MQMPGHVSFTKQQYSRLFQDVDCLLLKSWTERDFASSLNSNYESRSYIYNDDGSQHRYSQVLRDLVDESRKCIGIHFMKYKNPQTLSNPVIYSQTNSLKGPCVVVEDNMFPWREDRYYAKTQSKWTKLQQRFFCSEQALYGSNCTRFIFHEEETNIDNSNSGRSCRCSRCTVFVNDEDDDDGDDNYDDYDNIGDHIKFSRISSRKKHRSKFLKRITHPKSDLKR